MSAKWKNIARKASAVADRRGGDDARGPLNKRNALRTTTLATVEGMQVTDCFHICNYFFFLYKFKIYTCI